MKSLSDLLCVTLFVIIGSYDVKIRQHAMNFHQHTVSILKKI